MLSKYSGVVTLAGFYIRCTAVKHVDRPRITQWSTITL